MISRDECIYYLVREMYGMGIQAGEKHFEAALEHIRRGGLVGLRQIEIEALVESAMRRNREQDLDQAVEQGERSKQHEEGRRE